VSLDTPSESPLVDFKLAEHLMIMSAGTGHGKVDALIRRVGVDGVTRLTVPLAVSEARSCGARTC
jgi:hypothetical protein